MLYYCVAPAAAEIANVMDAAETGPFHGHDHDHAECVEAALGDAERLCARRGARLTKLRRRVLECVWHSHAPVGAYEILDALRTDSRRAAPPTVYRALAFLIEQGLVHRLESRNAYVGCAMPAAPHSGQFLICRACGSVGEVVDSAIARTVARRAQEIGFSLQDQMIELNGVCPQCRDAGAAQALGDGR